MIELNPNQVRYIKLGEGGIWAQQCIQDGIVRLGYESPHHNEALYGDWEVVRKFWLNHRKGNVGAAARDVRQIRDFYELKETDLWVTFHNRLLYWCRAAEDISELEDGTRVRTVIGGWSCNDLMGSPLHIDNLDGRVSMVHAFRGTICSISEQDYLVNKIKGVRSPEVEAAERALAALQASVKGLIQGLWWKDFELLVDLIFGRAGWQRFSVLGKTSKDIDLDVYSPTTRKRAFVQVKSYSTRGECERYVQKFLEHSHFTEMYFVCHTHDGSLAGYDPGDSRVHVWALDHLAWLVNHIRPDRVGNQEESIISVRRQ